MSSMCTSNVTSAFVDLATHDELEKYMYGGPDSIAYFVRDTRKATWFSQVPVVLSRASGTPAFGNEFSVSISRAGDYLMSTWLRLTIPEVALAKTVENENLQIRWTRNFMHNLIKECCITFNDLVAARFDNYHLDFWSAFTVPAGKRNGYDYMIGNISDLIQPAGHVDFSNKKKLPSRVCNLPLPFFYSRDSGVALPTAALPYNEMRINFSLRDWSELLVIGEKENAKFPYRTVTTSDLQKEPVLSNVQVWSNYAIVSNDERKRMACAPRDMLIEQVQTAPVQDFKPDNTNHYDIRFSHAIKVLFFGVRNKTFGSDWSNYTAQTPLFGNENVNYLTDADMFDPISSTSLIYENTSRLSDMGSDYFSLVNPYFHAPSIPDVTGYHSYSYSLDFMSLDPQGSTNYGKLTNVSICPSPQKPELQMLATGKAPFKDDLPVLDQLYCFLVTAVNNNMIRISGGALGFPVL